jgi:uncharacterized membrane protein
MAIGLVAHVVFGAIGLISGFAALLSKKGGARHILVGKVYVVSMLLMAATGFYYALVQSVHITMLAASLTLYLVLTSWLSVKKSIKRTVSVVISLVLGVAVTGYAVRLSWQAYNGVTDSLGDYVLSAGPYYLFATVALTALIFDLRQLLVSQLSSSQRISQHLWRMCLTLYVACSSFFQGQQQVFPESWQNSPWLALPGSVVLLLMLFWLFKLTFSHLKRKFQAR